MCESSSILRWGSLVLLALLLGACGRSEEQGYKPTLEQQQKSGGEREYVVGIHPLHNPQRLMEVYGPIIEYIDTQIPNIHLKLEASRNYEEFDKKLYDGYFDFAMPNPYQSVLSLKHGYRIFGKMADDDDFRGIILVRKDSGISKVQDLKGKAVSYPAPTALAATMMPQYYLHTHGIDVNKDVQNVYVGSQESSIMNVYLGKVAAGATWPVPWKTFMAEQPAKASQLVLKWQTEHLLNNGWVVRKDLPASLQQVFAQALFGLQEHEQGRTMLSRVPVSRFEPATDETYRPVRDFLAVYSKSVREIEH